MYTERKIHSGFVGTLFLFATVLLFVFHTMPARENISEFSGQIASMRQQVQTLKNRNDERSPIARISEVERKELDDKIPQTLEQDAILMELNRLANSAQVSFNSLTFTLSNISSVPTVNIATAFEGPSGNIIRFLKSLENSNRKFVVRDASVYRSSNEAGLEQVTLNANLQAFFRDAQ